MSETYTNVTFKLIRPNGLEIYPYEFTSIRGALRGGSTTFSSLTSEEISFIIKDYSLICLDKEDVFEVTEFLSIGNTGRFVRENFEEFMNAYE